MIERVAAVYGFPPQTIDQLSVEDLTFWAQAALYRQRRS